MSCEKTEQVRAELNKWLALRDEGERLRIQRNQVDQRLEAIKKESEGIYNTLVELMGNQSRIVTLDDHAILVGNSLFGGPHIQIVPLESLP